MNLILVRVPDKHWYPHTRPYSVTAPVTVTVSKHSKLIHRIHLFGVLCKKRKRRSSFCLVFLVFLFFYVLLIVYRSITLANDQLDAQIKLLYLQPFYFLLIVDWVEFNEICYTKPPGNFFGQLWLSWKIKLCPNFSCLRPSSIKFFTGSSHKIYLVRVSFSNISKLKKVTYTGA
jgi:hypothetical protein